jgi:predicted transcriptional regulator
MNQVSIISNISLKHPNVQKVIEIAEEIVSEDKILSLENLYYKARRKLKIPRKGLKFIIQYLVNKKVLVDQSKFTRRSILEHPLREAIYYFIKENLGVHLSTIRNHFQSENTGTGQLLWHLDMLLKFNHIKSIKMKKYLIFLPRDIDDESGIIYFLLRDDLNFRIVQLLLEKKELKRSNVYKELAESRELVYYHLNNLIDDKLIKLKEDKYIYISPNKILLIQYIIKDLMNISQNKFITNELK